MTRWRKTATSLLYGRRPLGPGPGKRTGLGPRKGTDPIRAVVRETETGGWDLKISVGSREVASRQEDNIYNAAYEIDRYVRARSRNE